MPQDIVETTDISKPETTGKPMARRLSLEVIIIGGLYAVYTFVRNVTEASEAVAYKHAQQIMDIEDALNINIEKSVHSFFLNHEWVLIASNYYYGSLHFIMTLFALFYVFFKDEKRYSIVRNTIVSTTLIALVGFVSYPLMPPRLLPDSFGFVDSLAKFPTFWSFNSDEFATISNQFAAMPSVHIAWSTWCVFALYPYAKKMWLKIPLVLYPVATLFVIVVTSNHYLLDAVGGWTVLTLGYLVSRIISSYTTRSAIDKTASLADINAK